MARATIKVTYEAHALLSQSRPELYVDAGAVLNASEQLQFLLGFWLAARHTPGGAEALELVRRNMAKARALQVGRWAG